MQYQMENNNEDTPLYMSVSGTDSSNDVVLFNDSPANNETATIESMENLRLDLNLL